MLGLHVINSTPDVMNIADRVKLLKGVTPASIPSLVKAKNSGATTIYRTWMSEQEQINVLQMTPTNGARFVYDKIMEELNGVRPDYVEALNEVAQGVTSTPPLGFHMDFMEFFVDRMHNQRIKVAGLSFSWGGVEYDALTELAYDGFCNMDALSIHEYFSPTVRGTDLLDGHRTLNLLDAACTNAGVDLPEVFITECGVGQLGAPYFGWRSARMSPSKYAARLKKWNDMVFRKYPFVRGACVFTSGVRFQDVPPKQGWEWDGFDISGVPQLDNLMTGHC